VIDHNKFGLGFQLEKGHYFLVYGESTHETTHGAYVVPVLMDADYPEEPFYSVFNTLDVPLVLKKVSFIVYICSKSLLHKITSDTQWFKFPLISQTENNSRVGDEGNSIKITDKIIELRKSSKKANGLDLVFDESAAREYKIAPKSELSLSVEWTESFSAFKSTSPCLVMPRSSFARLGLTVKLLDSGEIVLRNNSHRLLELSNRFIQLVLPPCFSFAINQELINKLAVDCKISPIPSTLKTNSRKKKNIQNK
jgi:dUTPase